MAVSAFRWKEGEGYDIHVLRGGPASKALDQSFDIDSSFPLAQFPLNFVPRFKGGLINPNNPLGVEADTGTGAVTAKPHPDPAKPKLRNFLMTARQDIGAGNTNESIIRIHVHDSIQEIWLTPSTLTVHRGGDERRFTVLALFDDGVIGDITEWPQLTYRSADASVSVANTGDADPVSARPVALGGVFTVNTPGGSSVITVELKLTAPAINLSAIATVFPKTFWSDGGKNAKLMFAAGPIAPYPGDVDPNSSSNVQSVLGNAANVLFLAEGFRTNQKADFSKMVAAVIRKLHADEFLQPFKVLKDSINYWSVFVPSNEDAVSILGDQAINVMAFPAPLPREPAPAATEWTVENMVHEGGLPVPVEASAPSAAAWVAGRQALYDMPATVPTISAEPLDAWNRLKSRALLNERDTAFGLAHYDRPRASGQDQSEWRLMLDRRRMSEDSLRSFIESLTFGTDPTSGPIEVGTTWRWESATSPQARRDRGLICILSRDDTRGGTWMPAGTTLPYFAANAGAIELAGVTAAAKGKDIQPLPAGSPFSASILAARVARGCGHAFGLGDEYGSGGGVVADPIVTGFNLQPQDTTIVTSPPGTAPRVIDGTKIKWLWPRIAKAGLVDTQFDANGNLTSPLKCNPDGTPNPAGTHLRIRIRQFPPEDFAKNDVVRMRGSLNLNGLPFWVPPSADPFAAFALVVQQNLNDDEIVVAYQNPTSPQPGYPVPSGSELDLTAFLSFFQYALIAPRIEAGRNESRLIADPIRQHIDSSDSPLNAPRGSHGAVCVPGAPAFDRATPTNLPQGPKVFPYPLSNTIGLYDGGGHTDCGVFRPAGRCRMRDEFASTMPFCHVCSYIIVDVVGPTMHGKLDKFFPEVRL